MLDFAALRQRMVDNQLRPSEVTDHRLIRAFQTVPREIFVEAAEQPFAYADRELLMSSAAPERRMMAPVHLARMIQALALGPAAGAMVVGCGSGYSAAILAQLAGTVVAVEQHESLVALARDRLAAVGAANATVAVARLTDGFADGAPYDAILIDGAVEVLPKTLLQQLRPEKVLAGIERDERISRATLYSLVGGEVTKWPVFEAWAPLLPGFERRREFVF